MFRLLGGREATSRCPKEDGGRKRVPDSLGSPSSPQSFLQARMARGWWLKLGLGYVEVGRWQSQGRRFWGDPESSLWARVCEGGHGSGISEWQLTYEAQGGPVRSHQGT